MIGLQSYCSEADWSSSDHMFRRSHQYNLATVTCNRLFEPLSLIVHNSPKSPFFNRSHCRGLHLHRGKAMLVFRLCPVHRPFSMLP